MEKLLESEGKVPGMGPGIAAGLVLPRDEAGGEGPAAVASGTLVAKGERSASAASRGLRSGPVRHRRLSSSAPTPPSASAISASAGAATSAGQAWKSGGPPAYRSKISKPPALCEAATR